MGTKERRTEREERERETRQRRTMAKDLWKDAEHQLKELDMDLEDEGGNNPWDAAAGQEITEDAHWEYWMRENANEGKGDAVFNGLEYKPHLCMHLPNCLLHHSCHHYDCNMSHE